MVVGKEARELHAIQEDWRLESLGSTCDKVEGLFKLASQYSVFADSCGTKDYIGTVEYVGTANEQRGATARVWFLLFFKTKAESVWIVKRTAREDEPTNWDGRWRTDEVEIREVEQLRRPD